MYVLVMDRYMWPQYGSEKWERKMKLKKVSEVIIERVLNSDNNLFMLYDIDTYFILFIFPRLIRI